MARLKIYNGTTWDYVSAPDATTVTTTGTQTLTNKTIDAATNTFAGLGKVTYLGTGVSYDNQKTTGVYGLYGITGSPFSGGIEVLQVNAYSEDWIVQTLWAISSSNTGAKQRIFHSGTTWTDWANVSSSDQTITAANEQTDTTCFPTFVTAATGDLGVKTNANLTYNALGAVLTSPNIKADNINEKTAANGVVVDGMQIKDSHIVGGSGLGVNNASLDTTAGDIGGAWSTSTCTLTVSGGTAPSYSTNAWHTTVIGKTVIATLRLTNSSGGTAGAGTSPLFVSLPYASESETRIGHGSIYNGGTIISGARVICNFEVVATAGETTAYLAIDDLNVVGAHQNNVNRYIYATVTYEKT